mgnify:CR=1 FL=1
MSRTIVNVAGDTNYFADTSLTSIANLDTRNAIFYIEMLLYRNQWDKIWNYN